MSVAFRLNTRSRSRPGAGPGPGCMTVFALPFAAVGVGMAWWIFSTVSLAVAARAWVETPARILSAELTGGDSQRAEARYRYVFAGRAYESARVSFYTGSDNIGSFQRDAYAELERHLAPPAAAETEALEADPAQPRTPMFRCFVNPAQPAEAVLYRQVRVPMLLFQLTFMLIFGGAGFGLIFGAWIGARRTRAAAALSGQHPDEPWKWRPDWASGVIPAERSSARVAAFFAVLWNLIAWPVCLLALPAGLAEGKKVALVVLVFPVIGIFLALYALRELARLRRFGAAQLRLATVPGVLGGKLAGVVELPVKIRPQSGFHLRVTCSRTTTTGSGKHRHSEEILLWENEQVLATDPLHDPNRTALPVLFALPLDQPPSGSGEGSPATWRLAVTAKNAGVDLSVRFELPVFRTAESRADFALDSAPIAPYLAAADPAQTLREAGVRMERTPRGTTFVFPRAASLGRAAAATVFALIWSAAVAGMAYARIHRHGPPWFFVGIFAFFEIFVLWVFLDAWFGTGRIDVEHGALRWSHTLFGLGSRGAVPAGSPLALDIASGSRSGATQFYSVSLHAADGRRRRISRELPGRHAAETLRDAILAAAGR